MIATPFPATTMPDADWWQALWPDPDAVLARLGITKNGRAVDLCCGDGLFTAPLAGIAREVLAIDLDPSMLRLARARAGAAERHNVLYIAADACDLARVLAGRFDFVLIANTFHGVPDKARLAEAVLSILAPGGAFGVINWHRRPREETSVLDRPRGPKMEFRMTPDALQATLEPLGFRQASLVALPPYHYAAIFVAALNTRGRPTPGRATPGRRSPPSSPGTR
ncbi:MAG: class I SAM-dependent methyltransferase [Acetobacteraceae bacterium]